MLHNVVVPMMVVSQDVGLGVASDVAPCVPVRRSEVLDRGEVPDGAVPIGAVPIGAVPVGPFVRTEPFPVGTGKPLEPAPVPVGTVYAPDEVLNTGMDRVEGDSVPVRRLVVPDNENVDKGAVGPVRTEELVSGVGKGLSVPVRGRLVYDGVKPDAAVPLGMVEFEGMETIPVEKGRELVGAVPLGIIELDGIDPVPVGPGLEELPENTGVPLGNSVEGTGGT